MAVLVDVVPLAAQVLFTLSAAPYVARIVRTRRSDQHSVACCLMLLAGHGAMVAWSLTVVAHVGLALSYLVALGITALETFVILYYRVRPGHARTPPRSSGARRVPVEAR